MKIAMTYAILTTDDQIGIHGTHGAPRKCLGVLQPKMKTIDLLKSLGDLVLEVSEELPTGFKGVAIDSRAVEKDFLFIAIRGEKGSGEDFLDHAVGRGATCVMIPGDGESRKPRGSVPYIVARDTRAASGIAASLFYDNPTMDVPVIAVTGTNGKTTFTYLIESILSCAGWNPGVIGTVNYRLGRESRPSALTTPDPVTLQSTMRGMVDQGAGAIILEASSHALDQKRLWGSKIGCAVFTNMTRDHLDYHKTMDNYFLAKRRLFTDFWPGISIFNIDDPYGYLLYQDVSGRKMAFSLEDDSAIRPKRLSIGRNGIEMVLDLYGRAVPIESKLHGRFNAYNILAAVVTALGLGVSADAIRAGVYQCRHIPGRMERIHPGSGIMAFVDYAHTPDAVERILMEVKALSPKRIITVLGCGGDRDPGKRPMMGFIASRLSDVSIFTSDNPRSEDPVKIITDMLSGLNDPGDTLLFQRLCDLSQGLVEVIPDRKDAIGLAAKMAQPGDAILVLGKGHETYQLIGNKRYPFDDRAILKRAIEEKNKKGRIECVHPPKETEGDLNSPIKERRTLPLNCPLRELARITGGCIIKGDPERRIGPISIDTRTLKKGDVFLAIKGENLDGHEFLAEATRKGADLLIVESKERPPEIRQIDCLLVEDTLKALGDIAAWNKERLGLRTVCITGSCGKTTTKDLISRIMSKAFKVVSTYRNFNNLVGLPLTLLNARKGHEFAVLEMGMNRPGEIERLSSIARPYIGIITNICAAHLEGLGDLEAVAREKAALFQAIDQNSWACVNLDDPLVMRYAKALTAKKVGYTLRDNDMPGLHGLVRLLSWRPNDQGMKLFIDANGARLDLSIGLLGPGNVQNAVAATAVALTAGLGLNLIRDAISEVSPVPGRLFIESIKGWTVIDDTYNANPSSVKNAITTLRSWAGSNPRVVILGDMLELGRESARLHHEIGRFAKDAGVSTMLTVGRYSETILQGAIDNGLEEERAFSFPEGESLLDFIQESWSTIFPKGSWILVKGSRGMHLERVIETLRRI